MPTLSRDEWCREVERFMSTLRKKLPGDQLDRPLSLVVKIPQHASALARVVQRVHSEHPGVRASGYWGGTRYVITVTRRVAPSAPEKAPVVVPSAPPLSILAEVAEDEPPSYRSLYGT